MIYIAVSVWSIVFVAVVLLLLLALAFVGGRFHERDSGPRAQVDRSFRDLERRMNQRKVELLSHDYEEPTW